MPQVGTSHPHGHNLRRAARDKLAAYPLRFAPQPSAPSFIRKKILTMYEEWSNNACRGYVIKAMENCGFKSKDIRQVLTELYEVFDFCAVEEAAHYYENWQS